MNKKTKFLMVPILLALTGCLSNEQSGLSFLDNNSKNSNIGFQTDQSRFISQMLSSTSNMEDRNNFISEFISQSDIQCQRYLNNPNEKKEDSSKENSLYMGIFDTVSLLFGVKYITDSAKVLYNSSSDNNENKDIYKDALSPEIIKAVEIGRARYAKKMTNRHKETVKKYTIINVQQDTVAYDKQCNREYGLIEINRALKYAQQQMLRQTSSKTNKNRPIINPVEIKKKVEAATKKVQEKEHKKAEIKKDENLTKKIDTNSTIQLRNRTSLWDMK